MTRLSQFSAISDSRLFLLLHSGVGSTVIDAETLISPDQRLSCSGGKKRGKKNKIKQKSESEQRSPNPIGGASEFPRGGAAGGVTATPRGTLPYVRHMLLLGRLLQKDELCPSLSLPALNLTEGTRALPGFNSHLQHLQLHRLRIIAHRTLCGPKSTKPGTFSPLPKSTTRPANSPVSDGATLVAVATSACFV